MSRLSACVLPRLVEGLCDLVRDAGEVLDGEDAGDAPVLDVGLDGWNAHVHAPGGPKDMLVASRNLESAAGPPGDVAKLEGMSSRGRSLSMFVVQRTFRTVRRGYDPDEVDRHLELVSEWFTSTDVGQAFTHQRTELGERERAVATREAEQARLVEGARLEADATLDGARRRAEAAAREAERTLAGARAETATIRAQAERERAEILDDAHAEAAAADVIRTAEERAATLLRDASAEADTILVEARETAERELHAVRGERERLLADARAAAAQLAEQRRAQAEEQLRAYVDRRRREADRLAEAARRRHRPTRT
jgi:DivIVA domain-containing protein